jgi:hypothetical protein
MQEQAGLFEGGVLHEIFKRLIYPVALGLLLFELLNIV